MEYRCSNCYMAWDETDEELDRLKQAGGVPEGEDGAHHNGVSAVAICDRLVGFRGDQKPCGGLILPAPEHPCEVCEQEVDVDGKGLAHGIVIELFDSPFDKIPREVFIHTTRWEGEPYAGRSCLDLLQDSSWADFRYFECPVCGRYVCRQSPSNGWHSQVRADPTAEYYEEAEDICLACYEKEMFENGISLTTLKRHGLSGHFFDERELREEGWEPIESFYITSGEQKKDVERIWKDQQDRMKLLINYDSMAIGGLEGYITVWGKPRGEVECRASS